MFFKRFFTKYFVKTKKSINNKDICSDEIDDEDQVEFIVDLKINFIESIIFIDDYFYPDYYKFSSFDIVKNKKFNEQINFSKYNLKSFIQFKDENYSLDDFNKIKLIGFGYYGKVYLVENKKDNRFYAMKCLKKSKLKQEKEIEHTNSERKILEIVDHPFIIQMKSSFQTDKKLIIVTDYYPGGELFSHLRNMNYFSHELTQFYFAQILLALEFLHNKKIIYRDLKPENIVLDEKGYLKLTDFGLAKDNMGESECTVTFCGTNEYLAPEIILGENYGNPVDVWCLGILLYEMYFGIPPFYDTNKDKLYKKIMFSDPSFKVNKISILDEAKDLITKLLDKNQKTRIKIHKIRSHPYLKNFNFDLLISKQIVPPFIPKIEDLNPVIKIKNDKAQYTSPSTACDEISLTQNSIETVISI